MVAFSERVATHSLTVVHSPGAVWTFPQNSGAEGVRVTWDQQIDLTLSSGRIMNLVFTQKTPPAVFLDLVGTTDHVALPARQFDTVLRLVTGTEPVFCTAFKLFGDVFQMSTHHDFANTSQDTQTEKLILELAAKITEARNPVVI